MPYNNHTNIGPQTNIPILIGAGPPCRCRAHHKNKNSARKKMNEWLITQPALRLAQVLGDTLKQYTLKQYTLKQYTLKQYLINSNWKTFLINPTRFKIVHKMDLQEKISKGNKILFDNLRSNL